MSRWHHSRDFRVLSIEDKEAIEAEVKLMLHASRDCLRNRKLDTSLIPFDCADGYFGEAFGVMRALRVLGFGYLGPVNVPHPKTAHWNLRWWFSELEQEVLQEENYGKSNECNHCLERYGKDFVRKRA